MKRYTSACCNSRRYVFTFKNRPRVGCQWAVHLVLKTRHHHGFFLHVFRSYLPTSCCIPYSHHRHKTAHFLSTCCNYFYSGDSKGNATCEPRASSHGPSPRRPLVNNSIEGWTASALAQCSQYQYILVLDLILE